MAALLRDKLQPLALSTVLQRGDRLHRSCLQGIRGLYGRRRLALAPFQSVRPAWADCVLTGHTVESEVPEDLQLDISDTGSSCSEAPGAPPHLKPIRCRFDADYALSSQPSLADAPFSTCCPQGPGPKAGTRSYTSPRREVAPHGSGSSEARVGSMQNRLPVAALRMTAVLRSRRRDRLRARSGNVEVGGVGPVPQTSLCV